MTFDQIEYFMSCASCLNFSLASKYHYVSVSTLSRNISALEDELGVKLFERGYHGHSLTPEGVRFFDFAEATYKEYRDFLRSIGRAEGLYNHEVLSIACYPFDNTFGAVVDCFSQIPSDCLGKKYRVEFVSPGSMIDVVRKGRTHFGVTSKPELAQCGNEFLTIPFFNAKYCIRPGAFGMSQIQDSISLEEIISLGLKYSDFLPTDMLDDDRQDKAVQSAEDICIIGSICLNNLPELLWNRRFEIRNLHLVIPETLDLPFFKRRMIRLDECSAAMEYVLFCKREFRSMLPGKVQELSEYITVKRHKNKKTVR